MISTVKRSTVMPDSIRNPVAQHVEKELDSRTCTELVEVFAGMNGKFRGANKFKELRELPTVEE